MKINVQHIAKLANLTISKEEEEKFEKQLSDVLEYVKKLDEVNTDNVIPTSQVTGLENVVREDTTSPSLSQKEALKNTRSTQNGFIAVGGIFEE